MDEGAEEEDILQSALASLEVRGEGKASLMDELGPPGVGYTCVCTVVNLICYKCADRV